jgi:hypothetical protein
MAVEGMKEGGVGSFSVTWEGDVDGVLARRHRCPGCGSRRTGDALRLDGSRVVRYLCLSSMRLDNAAGWFMQSGFCQRGVCT